MGMRTKYGLLLLALAEGTALAQNRVVDWESAQVHPLELTPDGSRLLAVNTADQRLEVFAVAAVDGSLTALASIPVGVEPVSVRARGNAEACEDQVHPEEVPRGAGTEGAVFPCEQGDIEGLRRQSIANGQVARGHDIADGEANQRQAEDPARDLALIHG